MKGLVTVGLLAGLLAFAAPREAQAGGPHVSVGIALPGFGAVISNGPHYYDPYPAYVYGPPIYVAPPVYYHAPAYYPRGYYGRPYYRHAHGYRHRHYRGCRH